MIFLLLLALACALPFPANAETTDGLGMWVWSGSSYSTDAARQELLRFCLRNGIRHLDIHGNLFWAGDDPILEDPQALRKMILLAGENGITTAIIRGDPRMFFLGNHARALSELRSILSFSGTLPAGVRFKGIKYDVEPYGTTEWKQGGAVRETVMRDYLEFLRRAHAVVDEERPGLWLAADTPFWWDRDEFILSFDGEKKRFSEHVQDATDFIAIMSYWRDPQRIMASVEGERNYAERIRKFVHPSVETVELKKYPHTTFYDAPVEDFWSTVRLLQEKAKSDPSLGGVRIHCYRGLKDKLGAASP
ncbi:MAG TPA: hypothetical protein VLS90_11740 [Thermodesulfobacteriota bacterium]|nr:hypothetical protein [Thermodesulfobacteriota bacterium]